MISIWEDDWVNNNEYIKNFIKIKLGLAKNHINDEICKYKIIKNYNSIIKFISKYSLQYKVKNNRIYYGIYSNQKLISVFMFKSFIKKHV